ncbi:MAG: aminoglycoside phosphotransferase family protein [Pyrinomonadaceae bacterium]
MPELIKRIEQYLADRAIESPLEQLTPDASTRRYFRFQMNGRSVVACVYPDDIKHLARSYIDVTELFELNDLPVAKIHEFDEVLGVLVIEDLGDTIMRAQLESSSDEQKDRLIRDAISLIPKIQAATSSAGKTNSIASRLRFDVEKLMWELNFFKIHYFTTFKKEPLDAEVDQALNAEFMQLSSELDSKATVLCHRDFHAANLMIDPTGSLRIIDHQDARIGSPTYDIVSLLLDRVTETPDTAWIAEMQNHFHTHRKSLMLSELDRVGFENEFQLQTVQRCLKAVGTFSFQSASRGKGYFVPFIKPMFRIVLAAAESLDKFPNIQSVLKSELR